MRVGRQKVNACFLACVLLTCPLLVYSIIRTFISNSRWSCSHAAHASARVGFGVGLQYTWKQLEQSNKSTAPEGKQRPPDFIIVGVRKSGTRALLSMITLHPQVVSPGPEVHYFDRDENFRRGLGWYVSQMAPSRDGQLTGEKSPSYFIFPSVPLRIKNYFETVGKKAKLLLVVREPVSRLISDFTQKLVQKGISAFDSETVRDNFVQKAFTLDGQVNTNWTAIRISLYSVFLERWLNVFEPSEIHFVNGDNLIRNPTTEMIKVSSFLGLDQSFDWKNSFNYNSTLGFFCIRKGHSGNVSHCLGSTKGRRHPEIDASLLEKLYMFFRPYNSKFVKMTGMTVDWDI
ncbi:heparan sulfate glucosamine 3-O-sulfotransferase 1-like [Corticium candelabrum]|uniref:heparan sulfate glucosamine 3-O-sulfotransferase 1-like n=1 Tax=Corticium candelabrum TaxID=121492 RepID=UPI002E338182|nr:heparan sulfate glucosamine 3-O-sulfotransferase 1-like [Corticium candelabrum]